MKLLPLCGALVAVLLLVILAPRPALAAPNTYFVNSVGDETDDNTNDTVCHTAVNTCTLRAAIQQANNDTALDQINFAIGAGGPQTITPLTALPHISESIAIVGASQPNCDPEPCIELNGENVTDADGLWLEGAESAVQGLVINRFGGNGIRLVVTEGAGIIGNYIGTDMTGTLARPNRGNGILVEGGNNSQIGGDISSERNLISSNRRNGIEISSNGENRVLGNYIGTNATGTQVLPNTQNGVKVVASENTVIGGTAAGEGNLISGNKKHGIAIRGGDTNHVLGNYIGVNVAGTAALPNKGSGVLLNSAERKQYRGLGGRCRQRYFC